MNFSLAEIEKYCKDFSLKDSPLLSDLTESTWSSEELPQMLSGSLVGGLLQTIIRISGAVNILEIGMFTGYSALKMAEALPENGKIHTCELMEKHINTFKELKPIGSVAYKLGLTAARKADIFASLRPKNEWDICAGNCIVNEEGGKLIDLFGKQRIYNQEDTLITPGLIAGESNAVEKTFSVLKAS